MRAFTISRHRFTPVARLAGSVALAALACLSSGASTAVAQNSVVARPVPVTRPFSIGERLTYRVRVSRLKDVGTATMWIEGPVDVRGVTTELLRFDFEASLGFVRAVDRSSSWLDPRRMTSYRYSKHERHPLSNHDEDVELYPAEHRWSSADAAGESLTDAPLDELSFMYFLRTLPLPTDTTFTFERHFDSARNPTTVHVVRREPITTKAGEFQTVLLEMRVRDPRHYRGEGTIRINLSDDSLRLPVRIESQMPVIGKAVMSLESYTAAGGDTIARR